MKEFEFKVFKSDEPTGGPVKDDAFPQEYLAKLPPRELVVDRSYKDVPRKEIPSRLTEEQYLAIGLEREPAVVLESLEYGGSHYAPEMLARTKLSHELVQINSVYFEGKKGSKEDPYRVMVKVQYPEGKEEVFEAGSITPLCEPSIFREGEQTMNFQGAEVKFPVIREEQADFVVSTKESESAKCFNSLGKEANLPDLYTIKRGDHIFKIGDKVQFGDRFGYLALIYLSKSPKVGVVARPVRGKGNRNQLWLVDFEAIDVPLYNQDESIREDEKGKLAKPEQSAYFKEV